MTLEGKVTIITGASRGIGRGLALGFAREGAIVVATARTLRSTAGVPEESLEEMVQQITKAGGKAVAIPCDVACESAVKVLVERTLAEVGPIDVLINNAGVNLDGMTVVTDIEVAQWDREIAVNLRGPFLTCKHVLPGMMERRRGSIINISSHAAIDPRIGESVVYGPSRAAVERFTLNLAANMRPYDIAVNGLRPGSIASGRIRPTDTRPRTGVPEDMVPPAVWLAQQTASTCSGRIVDRDKFGKTWP